MRGILICLFVAVIGVFAQNYGSNMAERLGPEYPQPNVASPVPSVDEVLPRLGAAAVDVAGKTYLTGGLAYLPNNWPAAFSNIDSLTQQHAVNEVNLYSVQTNRFQYTPASENGMTHKRAFHIIQKIDEESFMVWGGGSSVVEGFHTSLGSFVEVPVTGYQPTSTYGASSALEYYDEVVVVFGGQDASGTLSNDLNIFDPYVGEWYKIDIPAGADIPSPRYGASFSYFSQDDSTSIFVLYGGITDDGSISDEVWVLDLFAETWTQVNYDSYKINNLVDFDMLTDDGSATRAFHRVLVFPQLLVVMLGESEGNAKFVLMYIDLSSGNSYSLAVEESSNNVYPPFMSGFASAYSDAAAQITFFAGVRDTNSFIDTRSLNGEVYMFDVLSLIYGDFAGIQRVSCYPGFVFDDIINVCVQPTEEKCNMCDTCTDLSIHKKQYINKLKNKAIQRDYTGILRKCARRN